MLKETKLIHNLLEELGYDFDRTQFQTLSSEEWKKIVLQNETLANWAANRRYITKEISTFILESYENCNEIISTLSRNDFFKEISVPFSDSKNSFLRIATKKLSANKVDLEDLVAFSNEVEFDKLENTMYQFDLFDILDEQGRNFWNEVQGKHFKDFNLKRVQILEGNVNSQVKEKYLKVLNEFIFEKILIVDNTENLSAEMEQNMWFIGGSFEEIFSLSDEEWKSFFGELISDRKKQLDLSSIETDLIFYAWYDNLAGQIRFNLISAKHPKLSFSCEYDECSLDELIQLFKEDRIPEPLGIEDESTDYDDVGSEKLKVYIETLKQN